jgi:hypothetical protein
MLNTNELRQLTRKYWDMGGAIERQIQWYITNLLPHELEYARSPERRAIEERPCDTLILLVGYSVEPLLQTICAFQPQRLVLLLNEWYGSQDDPNRQSGLDRGEDLKEVIEKLPRDLLPEQPAIEPHEVTDQPTSVFRKLCQHALPDQRAGKQVIVDITGAKKSMDAGAFLFATYANVPVSYVNFDDYDEEKRRPYGFTCRVETLDNPYELFRLRGWERVRRLYRNYHFRSARQELKGIIAAMGSGTPQEGGESLFDEDQIAAAEQLVQVLDFYERWDSGDFYAAKEGADQLQREMPGFPTPLAVETLGDKWPHAEGAGSVRATAEQLLQIHQDLERGDPPARPSFYISLLRLRAYVYDELARIRRLIDFNEDYRSALLRAASLNEVLLYARLLILWVRDELVVERDGESKRPSELSLDAWRELYSKLTDEPGEVIPIVKALRWAQDKKRPDDYRVRHEDLKHSTFASSGGFVWLRRAESALSLGSFWKGTTLGDLNPLRELRNKAIHTYLSVPRELAEAALELAEANRGEYEQSWAALTDPAAAAAPLPTPAQCAALPWEEICQLCGLDFLPLSSTR